MIFQPKSTKNIDSTTVVRFNISVRQCVDVDHFWYLYAEHESVLQIDASV